MVKEAEKCGNCRTEPAIPGTSYCAACHVLSRNYLPLARPEQKTREMQIQPLRQLATNP